MKSLYAFAALSLFLVLSAPSGLASFPKIIDLNVSANGTALIGAAEGDELGYAVATLPDVNGDQVADLLVGAPYGNGGTGVVYLIYGKTGLDLSAIDLANLGTDGVVIPGEIADSLLGYAVASLGDLDGDNLTDFILGAPGHDGGGVQRGRCYLVYGSASFPQTLDLANLGAGGSIIDGAADLSAIGISVAPAGDFGGSSDADFLIGAPLMDGPGGTASGAAYVIYWDSTMPQTLDLGSLGTRGDRFEGGSFVGNAGFSVAGAFDFNGDGNGDLVIGEPGANFGTKYFEGRAYVIYGGSGFTTPVSLPDIVTNGYGVILDGAGDLDQAGYSVVAIDHNVDGYGDVVITAPLADGQESESGQAYIVHGSANPNTQVDLGSLGAKGMTLNGEKTDDGRLGLYAVNLGDVNDDDFEDLAICAPNASPQGRTFAGALYLLIGNRFYVTAEEDLGATNPIESRQSVFYGAGSGDFAGSAAAGGDLNVDGEADVIVGARGFTDTNLVKAGKLHLATGHAMGTTRWPFSAPTTGVGTMGKSNMSYVPYMDAWGDFTSGSTVGFTFGMQVDQAWSAQLLPYPIYYGILIIGTNQTPFVNGVKLKNATVWPFLDGLAVIVNFPVFAESGNWVQSGNIPKNVPTGVRIFLQQLWANPQDGKDLCATNCVAITIQ